MYFYHLSRWLLAGLGFLSIPLEYLLNIFIRISLICQLNLFRSLLPSSCFLPIPQEYFSEIFIWISSICQLNLSRWLLVGSCFLSIPVQHFFPPSSDAFTERENIGWHQLERTYSEGFAFWHFLAGWLAFGHSVIWLTLTIACLSNSYFLNGSKKLCLLFRCCFHGRPL